MRKEGTLQRFNQSAADMYALFEDLHSLSDSEQLMIENRLMILQLEYARWRRRYHHSEQGSEKSRIQVSIAYAPERVMEAVVNEADMVTSWVKKDLPRFKEFIESRSHETGAWRGKVQGG